MSKMDKVKRLFRPGHDKDDDAMYDTGNGDSSGQADTVTSTSTHHPTTTESSTVPTTESTASASDTTAATSTTAPAPSTASHTSATREFLPNPVPPSAPGELDPVSSTVQDSEFSKPNYTGITPGQTLADRVAERDRLAAEEAAREEEEKSTQPLHAPHDSAAAPLGGQAAAVATGAAAYEAGQPRDAEVDNATYTDRKFVVGGGSSTTAATDGRPPIVTLPSMPHVPGEYPRGEEDIPPVLKSNDPATIAAATAFGASMATAGTETGAETQTVPSTALTSNEVDRVTTEQAQDHHLGRDAAVGVGGGAAAAAAYAAYEKTQDTTPVTSTATTSTAAAQPKAPITAATPVPVAEKTSAPQAPIPANARAPQAPADKHHYGRDAALVGGAGALGAGAYAAYDGSKDADRLPEATPAQTQPSAGHVRATPEPIKTETPRPTDDRQVGRDAAVVGGAGLAGAGAYAAYEDHKGKDTLQEPQTHPATTTAATTATDAPKPVEEKHYGRDAVLAGGAAVAGAGAYAAYEDTKDRDFATQPQQPAQAAPQSAAAATPVKKTEAPKETTKQTAPKESTKQTAPAAAVATTAPKQTESAADETHDGRDAAVAGGAGGLAAYEEDKGAQRISEAAPQTQETSADSHLGRDAAVAGGLAGAGAGAYGLDKAEKDAMHDPAPTADHGPIPSQAAHTSQPTVPPEISGESQSHAATATGAGIVGVGAAAVGVDGALETHHHNKVIMDTSGRNKLHKKGVEVPLGVEHSDTYDGGYDQRLVEQHGAEGSAEKASFDRSAGRASRDSPRRSVEKDEDDEDQDSEHRKKHGLLSRIMHPNRTKREKAEELEARRHSIDAQEDVEEDAARLTKGV